MAVSLVSTGVQFPDSTIQTTAASAAPTATAKGAVVLTASPSFAPTNGYNAQVVLGSNNAFTTPLSSGGLSTYLQAYPGTTYISTAFYSSYYNGWFGMSGASSNASSYNKVPLFSPNGLNWVPIFFTYFNTRSPFSSIECIGVNDSNGTLYIMTDTAIYYSTNQGSTWTTSVTFNYGYQAGPPSFRYINTGTASTSKSVFTGGYYGTAYVYTAAGNSNTFAAVSLGSRGTTSANMPANVAGYGALMYYRHGYSDFMLYSAATNTLDGNYFSTLGLYYQDGFTTPVAISSSYWIGRGSTQGYVAYGTISGVTPNVGSSVLLPKFTNASTDPLIQACVYDGTRWMVMTDQGMFYTTNANPSSGWTRAQFNLGTVFYPDPGGAQTYYTTYQRDPSYS